uniref:Uncharacterized protein n=1 Tax=Anguilla anguilla TaxID=7936 RepID=A0A0E9WJY1_ANGAN
MQISECIKLYSAMQQQIKAFLITHMHTTLITGYTFWFYDSTKSFKCSF